MQAVEIFFDFSEDLMAWKAITPMLKGKESMDKEENENVAEVEGCFDIDLNNGHLVTVCSPPQKKPKVFPPNGRSSHDKIGVFCGENESVANSSSSVAKPQDADYCYIPSLSYDLQALILARFPRSEYWKLSFVNKRCLALMKSGEIFNIRRELGIKEPSVFMLTGGESSWWAFDPEFHSRRKLPILPSDICFNSGDKESLCVGTHILVSGKEIDGLVIWRYELAMNKWYKGPSMINPRCLFATATCGKFAFVAGGIGILGNSEFYDTAEKYNSEERSWELLPRMKRRRKLCAGCYMDERFYVIGGRNEEGELTCGEFFDEAKNTWTLIPDMLKDDPVLTCNSPPLVAVVNNELYSLEASSNQLKVYLKNSNKWRQLGPVPVRADVNRGWGVAFKSMGNELLVIGASSVSCSGSYMGIYTCCPDPEGKELRWRPIDGGQNRLSHFIMNCSVMLA